MLSSLSSSLRALFCRQCPRQEPACDFAISPADELCGEKGSCGTVSRNPESPKRQHATLREGWQQVSHTKYGFVNALASAGRTAWNIGVTMDLHHDDVTFALATLFDSSQTLRKSGSGRLRDRQLHAQSMAGSESLFRNPPNYPKTELNNGTEKSSTA